MKWCRDTRAKCCRKQNPTPPFWNARRRHRARPNALRPGSRLEPPQRPRPPNAESTAKAKNTSTTNGAKSSFHCSTSVTVTEGDGIRILHVSRLRAGRRQGRFADVAQRYRRGTAWHRRSVQVSNRNLSISQQVRVETNRGNRFRNDRPAWRWSKTVSTSPIRYPRVAAEAPSRLLMYSAVGQ